MINDFYKHNIPNHAERSTLLKIEHYLMFVGKDIEKVLKIL